MPYATNLCYQTIDSALCYLQAAASLCTLTGIPAKYKHPVSGLHYANLNAVTLGYRGVNPTYATKRVTSHFAIYRRQLACAPSQAFPQSTRTPSRGFPM